MKKRKLTNQQKGKLIIASVIIGVIALVASFILPVLFP